MNSLIKPSKAEGLNGVYKQLANLIGIENCLTVYKEFKGITITFPTKLIDSSFVKLEMKQEILNGKIYSRADIQKIAILYDYSERQIRRYLKEIYQNMLFEG